MQKTNNCKKPITMKTKICAFTLATLISATSLTAFAADDVTTAKNPRYDASVLVKEAFNKIEKNYTGEDSHISAYYKESVMREDEAISLNEAMVDIEKASYMTSKQDKIIVKQVRKNTNPNLDPILIKLQGGPNNVLKLDLVKYSLPGCNDKKMTDIYAFEYDSPVVIDGRVMYVVRFDQIQACEDILYRGKIYIDSKSHAVAKVEFKMNVEDRGDAYLSFIKNKPSHMKIAVTDATYVVGYKEYNGKWYYDHSRSDIEFSVRSKKQGINSKYTVTSGIVVTSYNTSPNSLTGHVFKSNEILADNIANEDESLIWELYDELMYLAML
jgi:hypothetical protein